MHTLSAATVIVLVNHRAATFTVHLLVISIAATGVTDEQLPPRDLQLRPGAAEIFAELGVLSSQLLLQRCVRTLRYCREVPKLGNALSERRIRLLRHAFRRLHFCLQQSHTLAQLAILASLGADALQQQASKRAEKKKQARVEAGGELTRLLVAEAASIERSYKTHIQHHAEL